MASPAVDAVVANHNQWRHNWTHLLRIPSISAQPEHASDVAAAAEWLRNHLSTLGFDSDIIQTPGHPAVFAQRRDAPEAPTVLIYGHYDVQPIGDASLWVSPPFEPTVRDGAVYARGSADDKGLIVTLLSAVEAILATAGTLPVNVMFLLEGEEEVGSPHLRDLIEQRRDALACDLVLLADTTQLVAGVPAIAYGTRGLVYKDVVLTGPSHDLHSGSYGGSLANPCNVVAELVAALKGSDGRIGVPGFYDQVRPLEAAERGMLADLPFDEDAYLRETGSPSLEGEPDHTTLERLWVRPTLDVNGLWGGYQGDGASTIISAKAGVKLSFRLVPDQDPDSISAAVDRVVHEVCDGRVGVAIRDCGSCPPYLAPLGGEAVQAARRALRKGFGVEPMMIRGGGTLPILRTFQDVLGADSLMPCYCRPDCNAHSPNEFLGIDEFNKAAVSNVYLLEALGEVRPAQRNAR